MSLPSWWSDKPRRRKQNARSRAQERSHAKATGGKQQVGSGSSWKAPGDVVTPEHLDELKYTDNKSFSLRLQDWMLHAAKAASLGREPRMFVEFQNGHGGVIKLMVTEVPLD